MGLSNSKLRNILNKYNPQEYFKIKLDITIKQQNIVQGHQKKRIKGKKSSRCN